MRTTFGRALRAARLEKGITQRSLANQVGVSWTYISKIEHGAMPAPSVEVIEMLVAALDEAELMMLSGKIPPGLKHLLESSPLLCRLIHTLSCKHLSDECYQKLIDVAKAYQD